MRKVLYGVSAAYRLWLIKFFNCQIPQFAETYNGLQIPENIPELLRLNSNEVQLPSNSEEVQIRQIDGYRTCRTCLKYTTVVDFKTDKMSDFRKILRKSSNGWKYDTVSHIQNGFGYRQKFAKSETVADLLIRLLEPVHPGE